MMRKNDKFWMEFAYTLTVIHGLIHFAWLIFSLSTLNTSLAVSSSAYFTACLITYIGLNAAQRVGAHNKPDEWWRHQDEHCK